MIEMPDKGKGYLHAAYEVVEPHTAESVWQDCMCASCQDVREVKKLPRGTTFRNKDEKY
jgi:hypothetical protein